MAVIMRQMRLRIRAHGVTMKSHGRDLTTIAVQKPLSNLKSKRRTKRGNSPEDQRESKATHFETAGLK